MKGSVTGHRAAVEIDRDRLWRHAERFATSPRLSGSPEEAEAFAYIRQQLDALGYRTRLHHHPGYVSWPGPASLTVAATSYPCITHAMAAHRPEGVTAPLVDLTTTPITEWAAHPVAGAIATVTGLASPGPVERLESLGAAGAIFVNGTHTHEMIVSSVWGNPDPLTQRDLPALPVVSITSSTWTDLRQFARAEGTDATIVTAVDTRWRDLPLLEAELEAPTLDPAFVLFSGHVDAWHLGAMDNGAANAAMLEVAAQLAGQRETLQRHLRIAFWSGHSHGRYAGSAWYADQRWEELHDHCVLHVNVDSVGGRDADDLAHAPAMAEAADLARRSISTVTDVPYVGVRSERAGDQSFYGPGVPSLFMGLSEQVKPESGDTASDAFASLFGSGRSGGFGWWWHTTADTIDKLDPERLTRDASVCAVAILEACSAPVIPLRYAATAEELRTAITLHLRDVLDLVDATRTFARLELLVEATATFDRSVENERVPPAVANRTIRALGRALVPLNYVAGDVFGHDRALKQPAVPALAFAADLVGADVDARRRGAVMLRRRLNVVDSRLRSALEALDISPEDPTT